MIYIEVNINVYMVYDILHPPIDECTKCQSKLYAYSEGEHNVYLCWNCGSYFIYPAVKDKFTESLMYNPQLLLELIKNKKLTKI